MHRSTQKLSSYMIGCGPPRLVRDIKTWCSCGNISGAPQGREQTTIACYSLPWLFHWKEQRKQHQLPRHHYKKILVSGGYDIGNRAPYSEARLFFLSPSLSDFVQVPSPPWCLPACHCFFFGHGNTTSYCTPARGYTAYTFPQGQNCLRDVPVAAPIGECRIRWDCGRVSFGMHALGTW